MFYFSGNQESPSSTQPRNFTKIKNPSHFPALYVIYIYITLKKKAKKKGFLAIHEFLNLRSKIWRTIVSFFFFICWHKRSRIASSHKTYTQHKHTQKWIIIPTSKTPPNVIKKKKKKTKNRSWGGTEN